MIKRSELAGIGFDALVVVCATYLVATHVISENWWFVVVGPIMGARAALRASKKTPPGGGSGLLAVLLGISSLVGSNHK